MRAAAEAAFREALARAPSAACWNDFGNVLADLGRPGEAEAAFRTAAADTAFAQPRNNLGAVLAGQGRGYRLLPDDPHLAGPAGRRRPGNG